MVLGVNAQETNIDKFEKFPFDKLVSAPWDANTKIFMVYVDDSLGSDKNDGFSWANAKKTITGGVTAIPSDQKGYLMQLFVTPGTYNERILMTGKQNGKIDFIWKPKAGRLDTTIVVKGTTAGPTIYYANWTNQVQNFGFTFSAPSTDGNATHIAWGRWVFETKSWATMQIEGNVYPTLVSFMSSVFDMTGSTWKGVFLNAKTILMQFCEIKGIKSLDFAQANTITTAYDTYWKFYDSTKADHMPPYSGYSLVFRGATPLASFDNTTAVIDLRHLHYVDTLTKPAITLGASFGGYYKYDTTSTLTDNSTIMHSTEYSGATYSYFNRYMYIDSHKPYMRGFDSTRVAPTVSDSVWIKQNFNGQDYWIKMVK